MLLNLYYTFINPCLLHENIVWDPTYDSRTKTLVMLQKMAVRIIAGDKYLAHTYKELGLMKFSNINKHLTHLPSYYSSLTEISSTV